MKNLKKYIRYGLSQVLFFFGYLWYLVTGRRSDRAFQAMISIFCVDRGMTSDLYSSVIRLFSRPYRITQAAGLFGQLDQAKLKEIRSAIETKGYYTANVLVPEEICKKIDEVSRKTRAFPARNSAETPPPPAQIPDLEKKVSSRYAYACEDLLEHEVIQDIMADESLLAVANSYLNATPMLDSVVMSLSTDFSQVPNSEAAQLFHFDMDRIKWLKVFLYLTDVDEMTGPHVFVEGTNQTGSIPNALLQRGYARIQDEEVAEFFPADKIKNFKLRRGTIFVEDTRGLHKGAVLKKGHRLLLQVQYNLGLFGTADLKEHQVKKIKSPALKKLVHKYPKTFKNFKFAADELGAS